MFDRRRNFSLCFVSVLMLLIPIDVFAGLESSCAVAVSTAIELSLIKANTNHASKLFLLLAEAHGGAHEMGELIAAANAGCMSIAKNFPHLIIVDNRQNTIGSISFSIGKGIPHDLKGRQDRPSNGNIDEARDYFALLNKIIIDSEFQGRGYSSEALRIFHDFLDDLGVAYTLLHVVSKKNYAARIYDKQDYRFTFDTLEAVNQTFSDVDAFLADSTQEIFRNGKPTAVLMVRFCKRK
jgi:hypothetical protein